MPTRKTIMKHPTLAPALPPSDQSKDGSGNGGGGGIVPAPAPSTDGFGGTADAVADTNGRVVDDSSKSNVAVAVALALNRPLPRIRKAKVYSSFGGGGLDGAFGGGADSNGRVVDATTNDGSNFYENAPPVVPPSAKKSRPNTMTTGGPTDNVEGIALPPTVVTSTSTPASPTLAATPGPVTKKRVTILDGTGYINGVQIGRIGSGNGGRGGPGSRCFDILDLNGARDGKNKPPSLGRFAKTPGLLKSAAEIIPDDLTEESETSPVVLPENSASFRKTPGADRNKQRSGSSFSNVSKKRTSSIALLANTGVGIGGTEDDTVEFAHTPADRAKARSHSKAAASSATKAGLLKKFETMEALAASKGDPQPIILSAQSSSGTSRYINAKVVVAYAGKLEELIIEGLGDRPGTYRGSSTSGLSLQLDRAPIDTDIYGAPSPLAYQPLSKTATSNNNSTFVFDDDDDDEDDDAVANNSWMHGGTSSPHRTYTLTSSNEKLVLSEPRRVSDPYDNSLLQRSAEDVATPFRDLTLASATSGTDGDAMGGSETSTVLSDDATSTVLSGDTTVAYDMPGDLDGDEGDEKGKEEEYFGDAEEDSLNDHDNDAGLVDEDQTEMEEVEDGAAFGISEGSGDILGAGDEDDIATLLLSTAGGGQNATGGSPRPRANYNSTIHMHSFLAGMAAVFLAQAGMGVLALSFSLFFRNAF